MVDLLVDDLTVVSVGQRRHVAEKFALINKVLKSLPRAGLLVHIAFTRPFTLKLPSPSCAKDPKERTSRLREISCPGRLDV